jgi:hypothetical protein
MQITGRVLSRHVLPFQRSVLTAIRFTRILMTLSSTQNAACKTHGESDLYSAKTFPQGLFLELHKFSNGKQFGIHTI